MPAPNRAQIVKPPSSRAFRSLFKTELPFKLDLHSAAPGKIKHLRPRRLPLAVDKNEGLVKDKVVLRGVCDTAGSPEKVEVAALVQIFVESRNIHALTERDLFTVHT